MLASAAGSSVAAALDAPVLLQFGVTAGVLALASAVPLVGLLPGMDGGLPGASPSVRPAALLGLGLVAFGSFLGEGAAADWSAVYLRESLAAGAGVAGVAFTGFALAMAGVRLGGDRLTARLGPVVLVRSGALVAALGLSLAVVVPRPAAALAGFVLMVERDSHSSCRSRSAPRATPECSGGW